MDINEIKEAIASIANKYSITKVSLFGSRASETNRPDSDIDLIVEFGRPVSLLLLSELKENIESITGKDVDVIHGPILDSDMIEVGEVVELYAA